MRLIIMLVINLLCVVPSSISWADFKLNNNSLSGVILQTQDNINQAGNPKNEGVAHQESSVAKDEAKKSWIEEFSSQVSALRSLAIDILIFLLMIVFVIAGVWEFRRRSIVIDPIDMPKDLAEKGYTPYAAAQRIAAEMRALQRIARIKGRLEEGFELGATQIDFTVPSAGISYRNSIRYLRHLLRKPEQRVHGEIISSVKVVSEPGSETASGEGSISIELRTRDGYTTPPNLRVTSADELPILFQKAALEIASLVSPYMIAAYWFREEQREHKFENTFEAVQRCFTLTPANQHFRAYVIWGNALSVQRKFDEAEQMFRTAAKLKPRYASNYNSWGNLLRMMRRLDDASAMYRKAISVDRKDAIAWTNLGTIHNDRNLYRSAIRCFRRAIQLDANYASAWNGWGNAVWRLGNPVEAEAKFARAIDLDPEFGWSYLSWARLLNDRHSYDEAIAKARMAAERTSIPAQAYTVWGDILVNAGRHDEAQEIYHRAISADPTIANGYAGLGYMLRQQHKFDEAIKKCVDAIAVDYYHMSSRFNLAEALRHHGRNREAIEKYQAILAIDSYQAIAHVGWGIVLRSRHEYQAAISQFKEAIEIDPTEPWAWRGWGDVLLDMHSYEEAISKFRKAVELRPWETWGHIGWGTALSRLSRFKEAAAQFETARKLSRRDSLAWKRHAEVLIDLGDKSRVFSMIEELSGRPQREPAMLVNAGHILRRLGRVKEATRMFEQAVNLSPFNAEALTGLAETLRSAGLRERPLHLLRRAVAAESRQEWARNSLGMALYQQGRFDLGWRWFSRSYFLNPERVKILVDWSRALLNQAHLEKSNGAGDYERLYQEAEEKLRLAIDINPYDTEPRCVLGNLLLNRGRGSEALEEFQQAISIYPNDKLAHDGKVKVLREINHDAEAVDT